MTTAHHVCSGHDLSTAANPDPIELLARMLVADVLKTLPDLQMHVSNLCTVLHFAQTSPDVFPTTAMDRDTWCTSPAYLALRALELDRITVEKAVMRTFDMSAGTKVQNWAATMCSITQVLKYALETAPCGNGQTATGDRVWDALPQRIREAHTMSNWTEKQITRIIATRRLADARMRQGKS